MRIVMILILLLLSGCGLIPSEPKNAAIQPTNTPTLQVDATATPNEAAAVEATPAGSAGVRACDYIPGRSVPARIPITGGKLSSASPTHYAFTNSTVDAAITQTQLKIYQQIWDEVNQKYVFSDFNDKDWKAIGQKYQAIIQKGLTQNNFSLAMKEMLYELDAGLSVYLSPEEAASIKYQPSNNQDSGGIGADFRILNGKEGQTLVVVIGVISGKPAEKAGLKSHDILLKVDGRPVIDENGELRTLGKVGTTLTVTVQTPRQSPREVKMIREALPSSQPPIDYCLITGTRLGYIHWWDYQDVQLNTHVIEALNALSVDGPLEGLIIDTRLGGYGDFENEIKVLSLFTKGELGRFIWRDFQNPYTVKSPTDITGSQSMPLVLLQDETSESMNAVFNGVLQQAGRARVVGMKIQSPFYENCSFLSDDSCIFVLNSAWEPVGKQAGYFNNPGVVPDVTVPSRWDLFTEATDPALAKGVELLLDNE